jgi:hypothetical protein
LTRIAGVAAPHAGAMTAMTVMAYRTRDMRRDKADVVVTTTDVYTWWDIFEPE